WQLAGHRLLCGDALDPASYAALLQGAVAAAVFAGPPYNLAIDGHVCGNGATRHREFVMASGEMTEAEFTAFLTAVLRHLAEVSANGAIHFICMDWRHILPLLLAGQEAGTELKNICIWVKNNAGLGSLYRSQHEIIGVFKNGTASHQNN